MVQPSDRWIGYVDKYDIAGVSGWAADRQNLNRCVSVEMVDEAGRLLARCIADSLRNDLVEQGYGNGKHGFFIPFDERAKSAGMVHIRFMEVKEILHRGIIDMDVETTMFSSSMPERYVFLMRSLAHDIRQASEYEVDLGVSSGVPSGVPLGTPGEC